MPRGNNSSNSNARPGNSQQTMNRAQRRQQATEQRQSVAQDLGTDPSEVRVQQLRSRNEVALSGEGERDVRRAQTADSEFIRPGDIAVEDTGPGIDVGVADEARPEIASRVKQDVAGQSRFARPSDVGVTVTEAGIENVDVNQAAINSRRRAFERRQARREAADELSNKLGREIDASDVEISDGKASLADSVAEEIASAQRSDLRSEAAAEFDVDPSEVDISQQDGELVAEADVQREFEQQFKGDPARGIPGANPARYFARRQAADELGVEVEDVELSTQGGQVIAEADIPQPSFDASNIARINAGPVAASAGAETTSTTPDADTSTSPGALATVTGTAASTLANNPVGNAIGTAADAVFGTDSPDGGFAGAIATRLDSAAEFVNSNVADEIRQSDPAQTGPVAPGVGGLSSAANSEFFRNSAATGTELANPLAFGRDVLELGSTSAQLADFVADEGPEGAQAILDAAVAGARSAPDVAVDAAQTVRDNPQQAAEVGTAIASTGVAGGAAFRGVRGAASAGRRLTRQIDADLSEFKDAQRAQAQFGRQRSQETVDFSDVQSGRDFEADLRQQELSQDQAMLRDQAVREQEVMRDLVDDPRNSDPIGSGDRGPTFDPDRPPRAGPSRPTTRTQNIGQNVPPEMGDLQRANNVPKTDLRTVVEVPPAATTSETAAGAAAATGASASRAPSQLVDADGTITDPATGADITTPRPVSRADSLTASEVVTDLASGARTATATGTATASAEAFFNRAVNTTPGTTGRPVPGEVVTGGRSGTRTGLRTAQRVGSRTDTSLRQSPRSGARPASGVSSGSATSPTPTGVNERIARAIRGTGGTTTPPRPGLPNFGTGDGFDDDQTASEFLEETFNNPIASVEEVRSQLDDLFDR